jgi:hypothetical protein
LELLEKDKIKIRRYLTKTELSNLTFDYLTPGVYGLRLIYDVNENNLWDTGDYYEHIAPERVEYYIETIQIRKGWDLDLTWILK